ncbi:hypothetical protein GE061_017792 [Apolygus lucorum]|uniref:Carboxylesterase type B domain-containing protein n=1 Tax=Apolygus lucorum TaxID=248454 RepID=A0A8S9XE41_APOLU|nr:hypothetical protein GE061_017792 [Apolygus lucorum]
MKGIYCRLVKIEIIPVLNSRPEATINAFYNIPYAQALNPRRRFEEPKDPDPWYSVLEAGGPPVACPQISLSDEVKGVENCLILNIFTPVVPNSSFPALLYPVIVYIHGGAYYFLSSGEYGPRYLLDEDVVLVTINYRIGIPGFGSTNDYILPGNLGLKDQIKALKWIQRNIHFFSGDRKSVTLIGMSAGAACVHFHYFSKLSRGLFHKGFMIGGTGTQVWSMQMHPVSILKKISENISCPTNSSYDMVVCLERLSPRDLSLGIRTVQKVGF